MSKTSTRTGTGDAYVVARPRGVVTVGARLRVMRELQEMTQAELAEATGIAQPTLSGIESDRLTLGVERAKKLAIALRVHPAVLLFPAWDMATEKGRKTQAG